MIIPETPIPDLHDGLIEGAGRIPSLRTVVGEVDWLDAADWIRYIHDHDLAYHFDDDPWTIVCSMDCERYLFEDKECRAMDRILSALFAIPNFDPHAVAVSAMHRLPPNRKRAVAWGPAERSEPGRARPIPNLSKPLITLVIPANLEVDRVLDLPSRFAWRVELGDLVNLSDRDMAARMKADLGTFLAWVDGRFPEYPTETQLQNLWRVAP